jgi:Zn finger protein HypA/HybF involved in hydrogenase expression
MHEMSIALEVCRMTEERVGSTQLAQVTALGLEVGTDSGIEPDNLEFCLGVLLTHPPFHGARVTMTRTGGDVLRLDYIEIDDERPRH